LRLPLRGARRLNSTMSFAQQCPRFGLVGVTGFGESHLEMIRELEEVGQATLTAAVVINPESCQQTVAELKAAGVTIYPTFEAMLAAERGRLELVCLPTGIPFHAPMTIAALEAGANVYVEKPLAGSYAETEAISAAEAAAPGWVEVGFQDMFTPICAALSAYLHGGALGELQRLACCVTWPRSHAYYERNGWAGRLRTDAGWVLDSPANNAAAHFLNLLLYLAEAQEAQSAEITQLRADLLRAQAIESFDTASIQLQTARGLQLDFHVTHSMAADGKSYAPEFHFVGTKGRLRWTQDEPLILGETTFSPADQPTRCRHAWNALVQRLRGERGPICPVRVAQVHTQVINALHTCFPIIDVPPSQIESQVAGWTAIRGIEAALGTAFTQGCLLSETGFLPDLVVPPWQAMPTHFNLMELEALTGAKA